VAVNNHTSVWGSFYDRRSGKWGYRCCHATVRNSYCMGEEGKRDNDRSNSQLGR
jgi:pre-mRNA-processing factor SLU7